MRKPSETLTPFFAPRFASRRYLLQYKSSDRRFFFWMQDPCEDAADAKAKDAEMVMKVNRYMHEPEVAKKAAGGDEDAWKGPKTEVPVAPAGADDSVSDDEGGAI